MCPQPRYMPLTGIEPGTFQSTGWRSIHWAKPVSAPLPFYVPDSIIFISPFCSSEFFIHLSFILFILFFKYILLIFYREEGREIESQKHRWERHWPAASCTPPTGDVPATNIHALNWNQTWDLSVCRPMLYPLSQTSFSPISILKNWWYPQGYGKSLVGVRVALKFGGDMHCTLLSCA